MTNITVYRSGSGALLGYEAKGHATARILSRNENDLICSAVSALTQTGVNAMEAVAGVKPEVVVGDGYLRCLIPANAEEPGRARSEIVIGTVIQGLQDIAKVYPKYIRIMTQEWRHEDAYDESSALRS